MTTKHWDIKRTNREHWTANDWHIYKFFKTLKVRGCIDGNKACLLVYNPKTPSKSLILSEAL